jgi:hypothetical protein
MLVCVRVCVCLYVHGCECVCVCIPVILNRQYASPALLAASVLVLSASKGLGAMPGARAAWLTLGDPSLVAPLVKIQSAASANASTLAQLGLQGTCRKLGIRGIFGWQCVLS